MSKQKENIENTDSTQPSQSQSVQDLQGLILHLQNQLAEAMSFLSSKAQNPNSLIDSINRSTPIPNDSIRVTYSLQIAEEGKDILNFSNSTVVHQALGANPVNTVSRVNNILISELVEPAVLVMQNYITSNIDKTPLIEDEQAPAPIQW